MPASSAYIIAARRSANGRLGGLHRNRRIEDLAAPVMAEVMADAGLAPARIDLVVLGSSTGFANPARLVGLVAGVGDAAAAITVDRGEASGLEAIVAAGRAIVAGDADVVLAGGAEAISMAPWRVARPRALHQLPRFVGLADADHAAGSLAAAEAADALARRLGITRSQQDEMAITSHIRAALARDGRHLGRELVALRVKAEENRDEPVTEPDMDELESLPPLVPDGTVTVGNMSPLADGAAIVAVVSGAVWKDLGHPPALRLSASTALGVGAADVAEAPMRAVARLLQRARLPSLEGVLRVELGETSAVQAIAFRDSLGLDDAVLNPDGGQLARGMPLGAASAVLVVRLFSALVRSEEAPGDPGAAALAVSGAANGQALAALFERS